MTYPYYEPSNLIDEQYKTLLRDILDNGEQRGDRTGTGTISVFGRQIRYPANGPFPLLTTKKVYTKAIIHELLWFLSGSSNIRYLLDNKVSIWNEWSPAYKSGREEMLLDGNHIDLPDSDLELNRVYGVQWRSWLGADGSTHDQIARVINDIKTNPNSRRHIVSAWKVDEVDNMGLPPCHVLFQFYVSKGKYLNCHMYQRSADVFLGVPFNIASYAFLTCIIAKLTGLLPGEVIHSFGDVHVYNNHVDQVNLQLTREPYYSVLHPNGPILLLNPDKQFNSIDDFKFDDFIIEGYNPHPAISAPISV